MLVSVNQLEALVLPNLISEECCLPTLPVLLAFFGVSVQHPVVIFIDLQGLSPSVQVVLLSLRCLVMLVVCCVCVVKVELIVGGYPICSRFSRVLRVVSPSSTSKE